MKTRTREAAECLVKPVTQKCPYSVVSRGDAIALLGEDIVDQWAQDPVRGLGPRGFDGFYSWNVTDWVEQEILSRVSLDTPPPLG